jgi:hypothetical protein
MKQSYLEVTFRRGKAMAAYYYLPRSPRQKSYRTVVVAPGMLVDLSRSGQPLGIEITAPSLVSHSAINRILKQYGQARLTREDLAPLRAA